MSKVKSDIAKSYINIIRFFHLERNFSVEMFNDLHLDLLIHGEKHVYDNKQTRIRLPLTTSILLRILNEIFDNEKDINIKTAFCVTFIIFLQSREFT